MDIIVLCLFFALPLLVTLLSPSALLKQLYLGIGIYYLLIFVFFIFMEIASWPFIEQYSSRPNQQFFQYLSHPKEVLLMLWADYKILFVSTALFLVYFVKFGWQAIQFLLHNAKPWSYKKQLVVLPIAITLLTLGARSGIGQANANPGLAAFSNNHLLNQLALNASYSLSYSYYLSRRSAFKSRAWFGNMKTSEIISRIKKYMDVNEKDFTSKDIPTLHIQRPIFDREKPLNLVIIIMEGFGSDHIGTLGGPPLTPNFDKLSKEGVLFTNVHAIGTRTSRGIEALVSGLLPTAKASSIMKMELAQGNFFTIASLLRDYNYQTSFIYGGESHFDNMSAFFLENGFQQIIDENDFEDPTHSGAWGISDEDTFTKANNEFKQKKGNFLSVILTISNHPPFDIPEGKIALYETPTHTPNNATKYADYALGKFFEQAKKEDYYNNTVFLITADHPLLIRADSLVPVNKYKIPGLIIAPGLSPERIDTLGSQIDLLPTALGLLGIETQHPMIGRNLLHESPSIPNKQVSIYSHSIAFRTNEKVSIHQPKSPAKIFIIDDEGNFIETSDNAEFTKDALAHILFPSVSYFNQFYRHK